MLTTFALLTMLLSGATDARSCDYEEFRVCLREIAGLEDDGDFRVVDKQQLEQVCNSRKRSLQCASDFVRDCMKPGERVLYETTTGGRLKVLGEMCTPGTWIHQGFLANGDCFRRISDDVGFCSDKFKQSQAALSQSDELDNRLKIFYGCCAFEWHRKCLSSAAKTQCGPEASDFVYRVATALGGPVQDQICSSSYSSCHGLHGQPETDATPMDRSTPLTPAPLTAFLVMVIAMQGLP